MSVGFRGGAIQYAQNQGGIYPAPTISGDRRKMGA